jgi:hypothetical protein
MTTSVPSMTNVQKDDTNCYPTSPRGNANFVAQVIVKGFILPVLLVIGAGALIAFLFRSRLDALPNTIVQAMRQLNIPVNRTTVLVFGSFIIVLFGWLVIRLQLRLFKIVIIIIAKLDQRLPARSDLSARCNKGEEKQVEHQSPPK